MPDSVFTQSADVPQQAVVDAHWMMTGTLCDYDEDTGRYEPIKRDEEDVVRDMVRAALLAVGWERPMPKSMNTTTGGAHCAVYEGK